MCDLKFIDGGHLGNQYLSAKSHDPVSVSLLKASLLKLGHNTSVEIVEETQFANGKTMTKTFRIDSFQK